MMQQLNGSFYILWFLAFLAFPLGGSAAYLIVGPADTFVRGALGGLITGAIIGLGQYLVLSRFLPLNLQWIVGTAVAMGIGLGLGIAVFGAGMQDNALLYRAALTGLLIGIIQYWLLREHLNLSGVWIVLLSAGWVGAWTITRGVGVDLSQFWTVFGSTGAIAFQLVTMLALRLMIK
jgi:hypothetical protein